MNSTSRMVAVDTFRGLCIVVMILVNNPGDPDVGYFQLRHAPWSGWTLADVVAPAFLWIVGFLIPVTLERAAQRGASRAAIARRIVNRAAFLIVAGFAISILAALDFMLHGATLQDIGLLDILQRIAICYALVACAYVYGGMKGTLWLAAAALLIYMVALLAAIDAHGLQAVFAQGSNFAAALDHRILGSGLNAGQSLVTLPTSVITVVSGLLCGNYFRQPRSVGGPLLAGAAALAIGLLLAPVCPINRYLWTPSFVLVTSGVSTLFYCALRLAERGPMLAKLSAPLIDFGRNPLLMYALAAIVAGTLATIGVWARMYQALLASSLPAEVASHAVTVVLLLLLWIIARQLNRRRLYLRL